MILRGQSRSMAAPTDAKDCNTKEANPAKMLRNVSVVCERLSDSLILFYTGKTAKNSSNTGNESVTKIMDRFCPKCNETAVVQHGSQRLKRSCHKCETRLRYRCLKCKTKFKSNSGFIKHMDKKCGFTSECSCSLCDYTTTSTYRLKRHMDCAHPNNTPQECHKCGKQFTLNDSLKKHMTYCGMAPHLGCNFCNYKTANKAHLIRHLKCHSLNRSTTSPQVDKSDEGIQQVTGDKQVTDDTATDALAKDTKLTKYHKWINRYCQSCHENVEYSEFRGRNICQNCKSKLVLFECKKCRLELNNSQKMLHHVQDKCGAQPSKCQKCNKVYASIWKLRDHFDTCGKEPIRCPHCPFTSKYKQNMKKHVEMHLNRPDSKSSQGSEGHSKHINRYCKECEENVPLSAFRGKQTCSKCKSKLAMICAICHLLFPSYNKALYHLRNKCAPTVSKCPKCRKPCKSYNKLQSHLRRCGKKTVCCNHCSFQTKDKSKLKFHLKNHLNQKDISPSKHIKQKIKVEGTAINDDNQTTGNMNIVDISQVKIETDVELTEHKEIPHETAYEMHGAFPMGPELSYIKEELMLSTSEDSDNDGDTE